MSLYSYQIVLLSFNHPDLTEKSVRSVLNLNFPASQLLLVHNGSSEKNILVLKENFKNIQHLVLAHNIGFSGGANAGIHFALKQTNAVFFLTNDTEMISLPTSFNSAFFSPLILKRNTGQIDSLLGVINTRSATLKHVRALDEAFEIHEVPYAPGTAFGISRDCFQQLQGFDESYHTYWEDVDLGFRAHLKNIKLVHDERFQLKHKIGKTCHKDRFYTLYLFQRNRKRFMQKQNLLNPVFFLKYSKDMAKLFLRICVKAKPSGPLKLWWKAIYD